MTSFFVSTSFDIKQKHSTTGNSQYSLEERKLMADILYEDVSNHKAKVVYDRQDRHIVAEIARQNDLESKANLAKQYTEKLQQMATKREQMEVLRKARVQSKLKRAESITKPDLLSDTVKRYDIKRSEVLGKIRQKEEEKKMKLQRAMSKDKPDLMSDITKSYDEKRAVVLGRIQQKEEETRLKLERKMQKVASVKSLWDKLSDNRSSEVMESKILDEEDNDLLSEEFDNTENTNTRHTENYKMVRSQSFIVDKDNKQRSTNMDEDWTVQVTTSKKYTPFLKMASTYNSFGSSTALPPIGYS